MGAVESATGRGGALNVPNALTGLRVLAVPVFVALYVERRYGAALAVFIAAMVTDWLDGIAARALKQFTKIGAIMDPIADKLMGLSALGLLCWTGRLPMWLLHLLIFREVCIFTAIFILDRTGRSYVIRPTRFGKYATFLVAATIMYALVQDARGVDPGAGLIAVAFVAAECIFVSWAQYFVLFLSLMRRPPATA